MSEQLLTTIEITHLVHYSFLMISCVLVLRSVFRIHRFLTGSTGQMKGRSLVFHAIAFGLFFLALAVDIGLAIHKTSLFCGGRTACRMTKITVGLFKFIAQASLCFILWDLGSVEEGQEEDDENEITLTEHDTHPDIDEFDEEDEERARIWNLFNAGTHADSSYKRYMMQSNRV